jgi:hypothetical protein
MTTNRRSVRSIVSILCAIVIAFSTIHAAPPITGDPVMLEFSDLATDRIGSEAFTSGVYFDGVQGVRAKLGDGTRLLAVAMEHYSPGQSDPRHVHFRFSDPLPPVAVNEVINENYGSDEIAITALSAPLADLAVGESQPADIRFHLVGPLDDYRLVFDTANAIVTRTATGWTYSSSAANEAYLYRIGKGRRETYLASFHMAFSLAVTPL